MISPYCERAIDDALTHGNAVLKVISANDVGLTGGHQYGFLLPNPVWYLYTTHPPVKGVNGESEARVTWQDGIVTESTIHWYGNKSRFEYRLTRFGKDFPFRTFDNVSDVLVLIRVSYDEFLAYILDESDDIEQLQTALGIEIVGSWGAYQEGWELPISETEDACIEKRFREYVTPITNFPKGDALSAKTRQILEECSRKFPKMPIDKIMLTSYDTEYRLFKIIERQICQADIVRIKRNVDDFLKVAGSIMNRRKSRAGRSFENHIEYILQKEGIPHEMRPKIDGKPDVIIPSREAYYDSTYPDDKLIIVGLKTSCKDRWRQVLNEGKRVSVKHLLTLQSSISSNQLQEMRDAKVQLIIPQELRRKYSKEEQKTILSISDFVKAVRAKLAH
jgi:hypothetical protein